MRVISNDAKGWICLDIDGTVTHEVSKIPQKVLDYIEQKHHEGWIIVFVTGRIFALASNILKSLSFPYYLVPYNGAVSLEMPEPKLISKKYLTLKTFSELQTILDGTNLDFVLLTGPEDDNICYYRASHQSEETLEYFRTNLSNYGGNWRCVESFSEIKVDSVPMGKIYGPKSDLEEVYPLFERVPSIQTHLVEDSARPTHGIIQIMHTDVDKGKAVLDLIRETNFSKPVISAGNDNNDHTLLEIADFKIAMEGSPKALLDLADCTAPPAEQMGIIPALELAILKVQAL